MVILEACVETLEDARGAQAGGAARVELCANLADDGTTPDEGLLIETVEALTIPVLAMVRPRAGSFVYSGGELAAMEAQAARARTLGARGIVTGAVTGTAAVDVPAMRVLIAAAADLPVTFHRAFDRIDDRSSALDALIDLGVSRVLTSGGAATAIDGALEIQRLVRQAAGRMTIVAGGGVRAHNVERLIAMTGVTEVHARLGSEAAVRGFVRRLRSRAGVQRTSDW
jgi:copper homeostasis protein